MRYKLKKGFKSINNQVEILDFDSLCYLVRNNSKGATGVRTISKSLLNEYIEYFEKYPSNSADQARKDLSGLSSIDKYEYGYSSTLTTLAKMVLGDQLSSSDRLSSYIQNDSTRLLNEPLQVIYYGAPGTGKSFTIDDITDDNNSVRTTFHPDSDYASFVGAYKPTMENVPMSKTFTSSKDGTYAEYVQKTDSHPGTEKKIVYKYVPQAFLKAYVAAWSNLTKPYFLIIEEINRGNCAQIFGDLFQLLDRNNAGSSSYTIHADEDISQFLKCDEKGFASLSNEQKDAIRSFILNKDNGKTQNVGQDILDGKLLLLPPNLYIWATMNTSDQSLFPIDSAFKRRWNWKYMPIEYHPLDKKTKQPIDWKFQIGDNLYSWGQFLSKINPEIYTLTESSDKQMGFFFAKADNATGIISEDIFLNKVLFYLWTDVFKDFDVSSELFKNKDKNRSFIFTDFFDKEQPNALANFIANFNLTVLSDEDVNDENNGAKVLLGKFKVNGGTIDTITWSLHQILKPIVGNYTYDEISAKIKDFIPRDIDVIKTIDNPDTYTKENGWLKHPLTTSDGISFVITNQWKKEFIPMVKALADNLGIEFEQI